MEATADETDVWAWTGALDWADVVAGGYTDPDCPDEAEKKGEAWVGNSARGVDPPPKSKLNGMGDPPNMLL